MCNLYGHRVSRWEYNAYFEADDDRRREILDELEQRDQLAELPKDYTAPGKPGFVVREVDGRRQLDIMPWGFPTRRPRKVAAKAGQSPWVYEWWTNARNLDKSMWKKWIEEPAYRCLVPFGRFSEPKEPEDRAHPRDVWWFNLGEQKIGAFAGVWKVDQDHGPVYSFVTCEPNSLVAPKHPKAMPLILHPDDYNRWLHGTMADVFELQSPYPSQLMAIEE